ncbi:NDMA-dependent alcohol dehydrogenase [Rhodococcus erythropolis]|uniref:NDMA-dependent alcohol dehydrogenase n=1 Tax=Rhodococcus erythropolis TaxID=1833 RepID=UPI00222658E1|nr:NDMA-dependent alcohol dehydrogenase [Rhodococcus erythropolis]
MNARAAVCWERNQGWSVEDVEFDEPQAHEILVKMVATGLCHSEHHTVTDDLHVEIPIIGGHEGAGIVERVGSGVTKVKPGDHIITSYLPTCGQCKMCISGHSNLCDTGANMMFGTYLDGTKRASARGQKIGSTSMLGTFSNWSVIPEDSAVVVPSDTPLEKACILACGITTGYGSAVHVGNVRPGDTVVVVGIGGIGGGALQGARLAGARNIVAVDLVASKEQMAKSVGATHFASSLEEAKELVTALTHGMMADVAILTVGLVNGDMIQPLIELIRRAGIAVVTGIAPWDDLDTQLRLAELTLFEKQLRGSLFGASNPQVVIPRLADLHRNGQIDLDSMITRTYSLDQINQAYEDQRDGKLLRGVVIHEH